MCLSVIIRFFFAKILVRRAKLSAVYPSVARIIFSWTRLSSPEKQHKINRFFPPPLYILTTPQVKRLRKPRCYLRTLEITDTLGGISEPIFSKRWYMP